MHGMYIYMYVWCTSHGVDDRVLYKEHMSCLTRFNPDVLVLTSGVDGFVPLYSS